MYRTIRKPVPVSFYEIYIYTGLGSSVGRVSAPRSRGTGFDPGPRHTKVVNNGTSCSPLDRLGFSG